jgi:hypothetical protein
LFLIAACAVAVTCGFATAARADDGGPGSPTAICQDLQDGKLDGTYTEGQWQAFLSDPTVQGYCSVIVPPCVYPGGGSTGGSGGSGGVECAPPTTTTTTTTTTVTTTVPAPVPLTPQPVAVIAPVTKARAVPARTAGVKGAQHTVTAPAKRTSVAPATAVRRSGTLPFTGMQLSLFLLVGLGLVGTGLVLRATGKRSSDS